MKTVVKSALMLLAAATAMWGQDQLATITSASSFTLRGATVVPGQGVPMWPVLAGDAIKAGNAETIMTFSDGSVVILEPGAEAIAQVSPSGMPVFKLVKGSARYSLKSPSAVQLIAANKSVTPINPAGELTIGNAARAAGFWTAGHTALVIVGAGAAAGLGAGVVEATNGGTAVSPSR